MGCRLWWQGGTRLTAYGVDVVEMGTRLQIQWRGAPGRVVDAWPPAVMASPWRWRARSAVGLASWIGSWLDWLVGLVFLEKYGGLEFHTLKNGTPGFSIESPTQATLSRNVAHWPARSRVPGLEKDAMIFVHAASPFLPACLLFEY